MPGALAAEAYSSFDRVLSEDEVAGGNARSVPRAARSVPRRAAVAASAALVLGALAVAGARLANQWGGLGLGARGHVIEATELVAVDSASAAGLHAKSASKTPASGKGVAKVSTPPPRLCTDGWEFAFEASVVVDAAALASPGVRILQSADGAFEFGVGPCTDGGSNPTVFFSLRTHNAGSLNVSSGPLEPGEYTVKVSKELSRLCLSTCLSGASCKDDTPACAFPPAEMPSTSFQMLPPGEISYGPAGRSFAQTQGVVPVAFTLQGVRFPDLYANDTSWNAVQDSMAEMLASVAQNDVTPDHVRVVPVGAGDASGGSTLFVGSIIPSRQGSGAACEVQDTIHKDLKSAKELKDTMFAAAAVSLATDVLRGSSGVGLATATVEPAPTLCADVVCRNSYSRALPAAATCLGGGCAETCCQEPWSKKALPLEAPRSGSTTTEVTVEGVDAGEQHHQVDFECQAKFCCKLSGPVNLVPVAPPTATTGVGYLLGTDWLYGTGDVQKDASTQVAQVVKPAYAGSLEDCQEECAGVAGCTGVTYTVGECVIFTTGGCNPFKDEPNALTEEYCKSKTTCAAVKSLPLRDPASPADPDVPPAELGAAAPPALPDQASPPAAPLPPSALPATAAPSALPAAAAPPAAATLPAAPSAPPAAAAPPAAPLPAAAATLLAKKAAEVASPPKFAAEGEVCQEGQGQPAHSASPCKEHLVCVAQKPGIQGAVGVCKRKAFTGDMTPTKDFKKVDFSQVLEPKDAAAPASPPAPPASASETALQAVIASWAKEDGRSALPGQVLEPVSTDGYKFSVKATFTIKSFEAGGQVLLDSQEYDSVQLSISKETGLPGAPATGDVGVAEFSMKMVNACGGDDTCGCKVESSKHTAPGTYEVTLTKDEGRCCIQVAPVVQVKGIARKLQEAVTTPKTSGNFAPVCAKRPEGVSAAAWQTRPVQTVGLPRSGSAFLTDEAQFAQKTGAVTMSFKLSNVDYQTIREECKCEDDLKQALKEALAYGMGVGKTTANIDVSIKGSAATPMTTVWAQRRLLSESAVSVQVTLAGCSDCQEEAKLLAAPGVAAAIAQKVTQLVTEKAASTAKVAVSEVAVPAAPTTCADVTCPAYTTHAPGTAVCYGAGCQDVCCKASTTCAAATCPAPLVRKFGAFFRPCANATDCQDKCCTLPCSKHKCGEGACPVKQGWLLFVKPSEADAVCCTKVTCCSAPIAFCKACSKCQSKEAFCENALRGWLHPKEAGGRRLLATEHDLDEEGLKAQEEARQRLASLPFGSLGYSGLFHQLPPMVLEPPDPAELEEDLAEAFKTVKAANYSSEWASSRHLRAEPRMLAEADATIEAYSKAPPGSPEKKQLLLGMLDDLKKAVEFRNKNQQPVPTQAPPPAANKWEGLWKQVVKVAKGAKGGGVITGCEGFKAFPCNYYFKSMFLLHRGLQPAPRSANTVAVLTDTEHAVSCGDDALCWVWNIRSGTPFQAYDGHTGPIKTVSVLNDATYILSAGVGSAGNGEALTWTWRGGAPFRTLPGATLCPNGTLLSSAEFVAWRVVAVGCTNNFTIVWNFDNGWTISLPYNARTHQEVQAILDSRQSSYEGSASLTGLDRLALQYKRTGKQELLNLITKVTGFNISQAKQTFQEKYAGIFDQFHKNNFGAVNALVYTPTLIRFVSGHSDGKVRYWDAATGALLKVMVGGHQGQVLSLAASPKKQQAFSGGEDGTVRLWDLESGRMLLLMYQPYGGPIRSLAVIPGGSKLVVGSDDGYIRIWDINTGLLLCAINTGGGAVNGVAVNPSNPLGQILTANADGYVRVYNPRVAGQA